MDIIVKKSEEHVDDLRRTKQWQEAAKKGSRDLSPMGFKSPGEESDYLRQVSASKYNVPGLPPFFPADLLWATGIGEGEPCETLPCGHPWRFKRVTPNGEMFVSCRFGHEFTEPSKGEHQ
jgi:hypothetical protein